MKSIDPNLVALQLDMGNLYNGGAVALDIMNQYPGRFEIVHVKDEIPARSGSAEKYESTILGEGIVNTQKVLELATTKGVQGAILLNRKSYGDKTQCIAPKPTSVLWRNGVINLLISEYKNS